MGPGNCQSKHAPKLLHLETHRAVSVLTVFTVVPLVDLCEPWGCNALRSADQGSR